MCVSCCVCATDRVLTSTPSGSPLPNSFYLMCQLESLKAEVAPPLFLPKPGSRVWLGTCRGRTTKDDTGLTRGRWKGGCVCVCVLLCVCVTDRVLTSTPSGSPLPNSFYLMCQLGSLKAEVAPPLFLPKPGSRVWLGTCRGRTTKDDAGLTRGRWKGGWVCVCVCVCCCVCVCHR